MKFFRQIKKNPLFANMTDKEIESLFDCLNARIDKKAPRDIVLRPSDRLDSLCVILEGNLVEFTVDKNGERSVVSSKVDGDMFGIPYCFAEPKNTGTFITAATEAYLLYIDASSIIGICEKACPCHTKLVNNLVGVLCGEINSLKCNNSFIVIKGMRRKIAKFIYDRYVEQGTKAVQLGVDRNGMARYLNVSRPSMSREMINMREEGIFDFRKDLVTVKDPEALRKIAEDD
jgi:CRP-like cAMP-binding protein